MVIEGSKWFRRLMKDIKKMDKHLRVRRIKFGFYRVFWKNIYVHEIYKECPVKGYDFEEEDPALESQKYYEEYEDNAEYIRNVKNFKEGYYDSLDKIRTRLYMIRHDKEFNENAQKMYGQSYVK